jgi:hypothetical protein
MNIDSVALISIKWARQLFFELVSREIQQFNNSIISHFTRFPCFITILTSER